MEKPIIGIVGKPATEIDMWHYMGIVDDIRLSLLKSGALVVGILPTDRRISFKLDEEIDQSTLSHEEKIDLENMLARLDGVVLEGGLVSNRYEEEIAKICIEKDIPILGICSGFNNLVRALDGQVRIDDSLFHNQYGSKIAHEIEIDTTSKLYGIFQQSRVIVNSIHTCIAKEGDIKGYKVVAKCPIDNNVEAIEFPEKKFVVGVKWHPELMESMQPLFDAFVCACKN